MLYDGRCPWCRRGARRFGVVLARRGFRLAPLQRRWVRDRLGLPEVELLREMRVLAADGGVHGGANAILHLAGRIWWARPLSWIGRAPGVARLFALVYHAIARRRHCAGGACCVPRSVKGAPPC